MITCDVLLHNIIMNQQQPSADHRAVARSRFPIQLRPLLKLLRAMTASGFLDMDTLSTAGHSHEGEEPNQNRDLCERHVFYYLDKLLTYSQIIRTSTCTGSHALYETAPERYGTSIPSPGLTYTNLKPIKLPGGTILPARSSGRLLTVLETLEAGEPVVAHTMTESQPPGLVELTTTILERRSPDTLAKLKVPLQHNS